jgi:transposase
MAHPGLKRSGFEAVLLETRHVKAALSAMTVKTDRKDARGACPADPDGLVPPGARQIDKIAGGASAVVAHKQLLGRLVDVDLSIRGILRGFDLKVGSVTRKGLMRGFGSWLRAKPPWNASPGRCFRRGQL